MENITDVGHMTEDADPDGGNEDKMEVASRRMLEDEVGASFPRMRTSIPTIRWPSPNYYAGAFLEDARSARVEGGIRSRQGDFPDLVNTR